MTAEEEQKPQGDAPATRRRARRAAAESEGAETPRPSRRTRASKEAESAVDSGAATKEAKPGGRRRSAATQAKSGAKTTAPQAKPARPRRQRSADAETDAATTTPVARSTPRLLEKTRNEIGPVMMQEFGYTSPQQVPRLSKVVLNIGMGEALLNARAMESATRDLTMISGQKPMTTQAKKSIAGFKIRKGMSIGLSVTLRERRMYEFMDRLISSALPRIRDFQGVSRKAFDGRGNYSLGIREQVIFPEIDYNSIDRIRGLQVVISTTASTDAEGLRFLELLGMPFTRSRDATQAA